MVIVILIMADIKTIYTHCPKCPFFHEKMINCLHATILIEVEPNVYTGKDLLSHFQWTTKAPKWCPLKKNPDIDEAIEEGLLHDGFIVLNEGDKDGNSTG